MKKRRRTIPLMFYVTPEERDQIEAKMAQLGTNNMSAYLRKIAIDGYVVQLDLPGAAGDGVAAAPLQQQSQPACAARQRNGAHLPGRSGGHPAESSAVVGIRKKDFARPVYTGLSVRILALFSVRRYDEIRTYKEVLL